MPSKTSILNAALRHLGQPALVSDPDAAQEYAAAGDVVAAWDDLLGTVLAAAEWDCCKRRSSIDADATAPAFGFLYAYSLPGDCLRVWKFDESHGPDPEYEIENGKILTSIAGPLKVHWLTTLVSGADFDEPLATAFALKIAANCALKVTGSASLGAELEEKFEAAVARAHRIDAAQGNLAAKRAPQTTWLVNRWHA